MLKELQLTSAATADLCCCCWPTPALPLTFQRDVIPVYARRFFYELDQRRLGYETLKPLVEVVLGPLAATHLVGSSAYNMVPAPLTLLRRLIRQKLADKQPLFGEMLGRALVFHVHLAIPQNSMSPKQAAQGCTQQWRLPGRLFFYACGLLTRSIRHVRTRLRICTCCNALAASACLTIPARSASCVT